VNRRTFFFGPDQPSVVQVGSTMKAEDIFLEAIDKADASARDEFLQSAFEKDPALREEVLSLIQSHQAAGDFLSRPAVPVAKRSDGVFAGGMPVPGQQAGPFRLGALLGFGGMGAVFEAIQESPIRRRVALKLISPGVHSRDILTRFNAERQSLALMDHPNIARILDAGVFDMDGRQETAQHAAISKTGSTCIDQPGEFSTPALHTAGESERPAMSGIGLEQPWFAMELIEGQAIVAYADSHRLNIRQRIELLIPVCDAVQHAHQKGVIHRDLKPSNILVTEVDGKAVPKVIDFGVAKALGNRPTEQSLHTGWGQAVGTLEYMSPEQAGLNPSDVDTRSDVYSLGVMLYELLTGSTPVNRTMAANSGPIELIRLVRDVEPPHPSARVVSVSDTDLVAKNRAASSSARLAAALRGDLDWIVAKAIEKDRARRYPSASALASDLKRHLAGLPVEAGPPSPGYRLRKFVRRNRVATIGGGLLALALIAGTVGTTIGMFRANQQRMIAEGERDQKVEALNQLADEQVKTRSALTSERTARAKAMSALRTLTDSAVERLLARQAVLGEEDKAFLNRIIEQYQGLVDMSGSDWESRMIRAEGLARAGQIHLTLGNAEAAIGCCSESLDILAALNADERTSDETRLVLAEALSCRGEAFSRTGNNHGCEADLQKCIETLSVFLESEPGQEDVRATLIGVLLLRGSHRGRNGQPDEADLDFREAIRHCEVHSAVDPDFALDARGRLEVNLGVLYRQTGDDAKAVEAYSRAIDLYGQISDTAPNAAKRDSFLGEAHHNLANLHVDQKRLGPADEEYRKALVIWQALAAEFPSIPLYQSELADTHVALAAMLQRTGKPHEAGQELDRAMAVMERLVTDFPEQPQYQVSLAGACCNAGIGFRDAGEYDQALARFDRAIDLLQPLFECNVRMADVQKFLFNSRYSRALTLMKTDDHERALAEWDRVLALEPSSVVSRIRRATCLAWLDPGPAAEFALELARTDPKAQMDAARILAICSQNIGDDDAGEEYSAGAVEILARLRDGHPDKRAEILKSINADKLLNPLRDREDFRAFLQSLED
jgi:eukaryotic-like serine/threonine-protein kinase